MRPNCQIGDRVRRHERDRRGDRRELRAAPDLERRQDAVHLAADGRARHDDEAILTLAVGDEIDVAGLVGHRDEAVLRIVGVDALGLAEDQQRELVVPGDLGAIGVDRVLVAERRPQREVDALDP